MDEVVECKDNGALKDDLLEEEGLYDVNEQSNGLSVASGAVEGLGVLDGELKKYLR